MAAFVLKLKTNSGSVVIRGLNGKNTVSDLLKILTELTHTDPARTNVLRGFPPKRLNLTCSAASLEDIGLESGETLIVEEMPPSKGIVGDPSTSGASTSSTSDESTNPIFLMALNNVTVPMSVPGVILRQIIPGDNSCLFTSVGFCLLGHVDQKYSSHMRKVIAKEVAAASSRYTEAVLGRPNREYCAWIRQPESWGGGIELSILSKFFKCEMAVVNIVSAVINTFGEDQQYTRRIYLLFDGVHYDALYLAPYEAGLPIQTVFLPNDAVVTQAVHNFVTDAHSHGQFTDLHGCSLRCGDCGIGLRGQQQASAHARATNHTNFHEVSLSSSRSNV